MEFEDMQGLDYQSGELFDIQVRLMELENMQGLDYQNGEAGLDALGYKPKNMEEVLPKPEFEVDLFVFWLLMLSFVLLGQGCVFLSIMIKECKGMPVDKVIDSPASPAENTGDRLGATKLVNLVRSEVVQFYSVHNENVDLVLEEMDLCNFRWRQCWQCLLVVTVSLSL